MKDITLAVIGAIIVTIAVTLMISDSLFKTEKFECYQLQNQAGEYTDFYITQWQKDQCDSYDIIINAPVK